MGDNPWKIDRFDDIWSGLVVKKICDRMGYSIINGKPLCRHNKAPRSTFKDIMLEAPGLEANETLHKLIHSVDLVSDDIYVNVLAVSKKMSESQHPFVSYCGNHLAQWIEMLGKVS
jgi:hypothetical protein